MKTKALCKHLPKEHFASQVVICKALCYPLGLSTGYEVPNRGYNNYTYNYLPLFAFTKSHIFHSVSPRVELAAFTYSNIIIVMGNPTPIWGTIVRPFDQNWGLNEKSR